MSDIYSFYQLISKYQIEIPIIQRDYAQGRNNAKARDVRKSLVANMIKAVKEDKPLFFDFVYGRVDNNKFIPFDGQQRLTTLFLFHKYVFEKCQSDSGCNHKDNCIVGDILGGFSYATRQSSREFCEKLVQEKTIPESNKGNSLTENIKNQAWFYPDWEKDPTVMGMLTMLDEIHCQMKNENENNFKIFAEKLTSGCNCPITFHFVDMGEHKMSDETYVKMNARGKTLTPFENFKASLEQYLEDKQHLEYEKEDNKLQILQSLKKRLKEKMDGDWLDLFWNKNGKALPDTLMMSFFNRHFMNVWWNWYAKKSEKKDEYDAFNTRIQNEMRSYPTKDDFVSFEIYSYIMDKCGVDVCLFPIFNIWDALVEDKDKSIEKDCQAVWNRDEEKAKWDLYQGKSDSNTETYSSQVAFYALMKYFANTANTANTSNLAQWMRVVWNIIENSTIDSSDTYHAALRLIEKLSAKSHTIYNALANEFKSFELGKIYHAQEQVAEEIVKAGQILNGEPRSDGKIWEEIIIEAEKYAFFKGAIRFLFTDDEGKINWCDFDRKWKNAKSLIPVETKERHTIKLMIPFMTDDVLKKCFFEYYLSNEDGNLKGIFLHSFKGLHNFFMQQNKTESQTLLQDDLIYLCEKFPRYWIHQDWVNGLDVLSNYSRRTGVYEIESYVIGNNFFPERLRILQGIEGVNILSYDENLENGRKIWKGLFIEFEYGGQKFRWQSGDWVDMYDNQMNNLWKKGLHSHYNGKEKESFKDAESLKKELDRCCGTYI